MVARPHKAVLLEPLHQELEPAVVPQALPDPMPKRVLNAQKECLSGSGRIDCSSSAAG